MLEKGDVVSGELLGIMVTPDSDQTQEITLSSIYKKQTLVLFFYPKDMTPGCTIEVKSFRDLHDAYLEKSVTLIGCSRDHQDKHTKFIQKHDLPYPLLVDHTGEITEHFGVWQKKSMFGKSYMGIQRSTFIIDTNGAIIHAFPKVSVTSHAQTILNLL